MQVQEKYFKRETAIARCDQLKKENPAEDFTVIESQNDFYVENGTPLIRNFETRIYWK